jgi:hypothetical protein
MIKRCPIKKNMFHYNHYHIISIITHCPIKTMFHDKKNTQTQRDFFTSACQHGPDVAQR